jgi:coenzyme PQQ synthesis protein D (PqqD)
MQVLSEQLLTRNGAVETAPLQKDAILYHPDSKRFCILNQTSAFIWDRLQSPSSATQIAEGLSVQFSDVTPATALKDVQEALSTMLELGLVVVHSPERLG